MSTKRFRIAFSFAGEKRDFVAEVANILAKRFGEDAILYDKFHEAEFARARLGRYLPKLYYEESELIVVVICSHYAQKEWTGLEWDAIFDLLKQRREQEVLLGRFDQATVDGLYSDAGFIDFDQKTPAQTSTVILERLALNEGRPKDYYLKIDTTGRSALKTTIPNNLPRLQSFFGREKELAVIREALDPESRTWGALIDGVGGIGKTSLAVRAAYDCAPDSFKRIIFLSVKARELDDDGLRELGPFILPGFLEMLNELARELGQADITKSPEDQRIRLLLEALRDTHTLLILDNLESLTKGDRDQLFTFVKRLPQDCKAILTSRLRIGSSSDELMLEELDETAALEMIVDLARHNPLLEKTSEAERIALYKQTGGKPLLLRWVAGQIGRGSCRTFADALRFLRSCPKDNDPLEFIFGELAEDFTTEETSVLASLTYFTLPAKVEHIVDVSGLDAEPVATALRSLANRSLVLPDQEESQFALVPMVAEFMRRKRREFVAETGRRLEERAYALITENGYKNHDRFPVLDAAWPVGAAALPLFVDGENDRLETVCRALQDFLDFTGRWDERLSLSEQAEAKALAAGDHNNAGWRAYDAGWVHFLRRNADATLACAERARAHWNTAEAGIREHAFAIRQIGLSHQLKKEYAASISAYRASLDLLHSKSEETEDVAIVLNDLAAAERLSGDLDGAERDFREALRIARAVGYAEGVATYTGNLALLALQRKDWPRAESNAREALTLSEQVGRQELIGLDCRRLAIALVRQGKRDEAQPYARRAVEIFTRLGYPDLEGARATLAECESESEKSEER